MEYIIYKEDDVTRIKWTGKYTTGFTWCRGTIVNLTNHGGMDFNTSTSLRNESIDEILEDLHLNFMKNPHLSSEFRPITYDRFEKLVYGTFTDEDYYNDEDGFCKFCNDDNKCVEIITYFEQNKDNIKNAELILFRAYYFDISIIYNKQHIIDELNYINIIAKNNNVEFRWV